MLRALSLAAPIAAVTLLAPSPCGAAPAEHPVDLRLEYTLGAGAERCLGAETFRVYVAVNLHGLDPFVPEQAQQLRTGTLWRQVRVHIARGGQGFKGSLRAFDEKDDEVWNESINVLQCSDAVQGLALIFAIGFKPSYPASPPAVAPPPPSPAPPPPPLPPPAVAPAPPRPAAARSPNPTPHGASSSPPFQLGIGPFLAFGRTPSDWPAPGVLISAAVRPSWFSIALDGRALLPVLSVSPPRDFGRGARLRFSQFTASLAPCVHPGVLFFCFPVEFGVYDISTTSNLAVSMTAPAIATFGFRAGLQVNFAKRFAIRGYGEATATPTPPVLRIDGQQVWRGSAFSGVISAALAVTLETSP